MTWCCLFNTLYPLGSSYQEDDSELFFESHNTRRVLSARIGSDWLDENKRNSLKHITLYISYIWKHRKRTLTAHRQVYYTQLTLFLKVKETSPAGFCLILCSTSSPINHHSCHVCQSACSTAWVKHGMCMQCIVLIWSDGTNSLLDHLHNCI